MSEIKFEEALAKLEKIVEKLESGELSLEESITKYEEGIKLSKACSKKLKDAREKVEMLVKSDSGKLQTKPFPSKKSKKAKKENNGELLF